jgi:predicted lipoprotein with Yx(FWY)xxD motif
MRTTTLALSALFLAGSIGVVSYATAAPLAARNGMTLYIFDKDAGGVSSCYKDCAAMWPPALARTGEKADPGWTTVMRTDGAMQWVYKMLLQGWSLL